MCFIFFGQSRYVRVRFFTNLHCIFISLVNSAPLKLNENNEIECIQGFCYCLFSYNLVFVSRIPYLVSGPTHFHFTQDVFVYLLDVWIHKPFFYLFSMIAKLLVLTVIEKNTQDNIRVFFFLSFWRFFTSNKISSALRKTQKIGIFPSFFLKKFFSQGKHSLLL